MICQYCGSEITEGLVICTNCGSTILHNQKNNNTERKTITNKNEALISDQIDKKVNDKINVGICLISLTFVPIVGLIYFLFYRKTYPKKSKAAIICTIAHYVFFVLFFLAGFLRQYIFG